MLCTRTWLHVVSFLLIAKRHSEKYEDTKLSGIWSNFARVWAEKIQPRCEAEPPRSAHSLF